MASEIIVPELGESIVEATVARWLKQPGEPVKVGEAVVELETDKVNLEVAAEQDGVLASINVKAGEDVGIGDILGVIEAEATSHEGGQKREEERGEGEEGEGKGEERGKKREGAEERATPMARKLAKEQDIELAQVTPGDDRITKEDVKRYLGQKEAEQERREEGRKGDKIEAKKMEEEAKAPPSPIGKRSEREERVKMTRRRRTIARRLVEAQQSAAMLTTFNEIDMSAVIALRERRRESFQQRHGVKLGFMSFFVKAAVGALKQFPELNAEIEGDEIILKHYYDIGMAIGAEEGLVVPVLRAADRLTFAEIEQVIEDYVKKVREGSLSLEDLRGGTFSITNGGVFGSLLSTPILNPPQVGILGLHKIEKRPVALNDQVVIRPMMYVALSYDHRIVDGREAVQFLVKIKELVEDPETLLLEG